MATMAEAQKKARQFADDTGEDLSERLDATLSQLQSLRDSIAREGGRQMDRAQRTAGAAAHQADVALRENPYAFLGAAVTLGFLLGMLLTRR